MVAIREPQLHQAHHLRLQGLRGRDHDLFQRGDGRVHRSGPRMPRSGCRLHFRLRRPACSFTDRSTDADGTVTAWRWAFGDGGTSTSRNPTHVYAAAASTYTVALTVTDNAGADQDPVGLGGGDGYRVHRAYGHRQGGHAREAVHDADMDWRRRTHHGHLSQWRVRVVTGTPNDGKQIDQQDVHRSGDVPSSRSARAEARSARTR